MTNKKIYFGLNLLVLIIFFIGFINAAILFQDDFDDYTGKPTDHGWNAAGKDVNVVSGVGVGGSNAVRISYNSDSGSGRTAPYTLRKTVSQTQPDELYIKFDFRTDLNHNSDLGGSKFVKIVGGGYLANSGSTASSTTFGFDYSSNTVSRVSYGGDARKGDTQTILKLDGDCAAWVVGQCHDVDFVKVSSPLDFRDGKWHNVVLHMKYNTVTNGVNNRDGEYDIWVDGELRFSARKVINIHPENPHYWEQVFFGDYTNSLPSSTVNFYYDNIIIADSPIDGTSSPSPSPEPTPTPSPPTNTGKILYQNCAPGGSCTGAGSKIGWTRTVETNGCYSGQCLKLVGTANTNSAALAAGIYGAGSTSIATHSIKGKKEITIQYRVKFNENAGSISGGNLKSFIPYLGNVRWGTVILPHPSGDFYISRVIGTFTTAPWFNPVTTKTNKDYAVVNSDGTYYSWNGHTLGRFNNMEEPGTEWKKITVYFKLPTTDTSNDGIVKVWYEDELMLDFKDSSVKGTGATDTFTHLTFYSSSEAKEPFEHWMDDMIIYEGYVPPTGSSTPTPTPEQPPTQPVVCTTGQTKSCSTGLSGICSTGTQTCSNNAWGSCTQTKQATTEICGNNLDDDCDGIVDEGCEEQPVNDANILFSLCGDTCSTGANSKTGWVRTIETDGCYSGECLKLTASLNSGTGLYGAGNTMMGASGISGKDEITVQYYTKFSESMRTLSGANIKSIRPYVGDHSHYFMATISGFNLVKNNDFRFSYAKGTVKPTSFFDILDEKDTYVGDTRYSVSNGDGTWTINGLLAGKFNQGGYDGFGTQWTKVTQWIKLPSTPTGNDGESKLWVNGELLFHLYDASMSSGSTSTFSGFTFYPSSEAREPFEHWMDEMVIYEGYVPPTSSSTPVTSCNNGQTKSCSTGLSGICSSGTQTCSNNAWGSCIQTKLATTEICGNNLDDDCDGSIDENCNVQVPTPNPSNSPILEDTYLNINDINYNSQESLNTYTWPKNTIANSIIIKLDMSKIENISDISNVQLGLNLRQFGGDNIYDISVHRIINNNPTLSLATGKKYDGTNLWSSLLAQNDISTAEDTLQVDKTLGYKYWNITNIVKYWAQNPTKNYGLLLNSDSIASSDSYRYFASLENSNENLRPTLIINYNTNNNNGGIVSCIHGADKQPCNGKIEFSEILVYLGLWTQNQVSFKDVIDVIKLWKKG